MVCRQHEISKSIAGAIFPIGGAMSTVDPLDQLRKLAALKAEGIIDDAEFARMKSGLLEKAAENRALVKPSVSNQPQTEIRCISPNEVAESRTRLTSGRTSAP
jgi:hypothetical protein